MQYFTNNLMALMKYSFVRLKYNDSYEERMKKISNEYHVTTDSCDTKSWKLLERTHFKAGSVVLGVHKHGRVKYCCSLVDRKSVV